MITRAIVTDLDYDNCRIQVRIPILDGIESDQNETPNSELNWASVLCIPGLENQYKEGDVVIVGFEDNDLGRPIILGYLMLKGTKLTSNLHGEFKELVVSESFEAPINTTIGKTPYSKIFDAAEAA